MKRTIALVLSLLFLLVLVPSTALADNDVEARLEVTVPDATQTLFQYGIDSFNWTSPSLVVTLYDKLTNSGGTVLPTMGSAIASGTLSSRTTKALTWGSKRSMRASASLATSTGESSRDA